MKYTKKQREDAALICQLSASNKPHESYGLVVELLGRKRNQPAERLALSAWCAVSLIASGAECDAEAESWIRCGWSQPGDERKFS